MRYIIFAFSIFILTLFSSLLVSAEVEIPYFAGDSSSVDSSKGNLIILNDTRGFFQLPLSANSIPEGALPVDNPTFAINDTLALTSDAPGKDGLIIYRENDGSIFVNTFVGDHNESIHAVSYFGEGSFVAVSSMYPDDCKNLNLRECRLSPNFLRERSFSVTQDGISVPQIIEEETFVEAVVDFVADLFTKDEPADKPVEVVEIVEPVVEITPEIIVSDTNAESITSPEVGIEVEPKLEPEPVPEIETVIESETEIESEPVTVIEPEVELEAVEAPTVDVSETISGNTENNETTTTTF